MFMLDSSHIAQLAKSNQQVIIISDYYSHEIVAPNSWEKALFSEICQIIGGSQPPKEYFINEPQEGYIRLIQIRDYKTDKFATYIPIELAKRFCQKEDIMIGRYGPPIFQILRGLEGAYNVALMKAEPNTNLFDKEFLYYFLQTPQLFNYVASASLRTAGQDGVRKELLDNYPVFVPPLNEQRRIVAKIEALKARSQRVKEELEAIAPLLDQFRQSVLAAAFRGDLTADWREKNPDVEPASELLKEIREKCRERYEKECFTAQIEGKRKPQKPKNFGIPATDIQELSDVPESWCWIYFGELISKIRSGSPAVPKDEATDYPILRSSSVRPSSVDLEDIRFLTQEQSLNDDNFLGEGDLLFTRLSGSLDYVANCALVRNLNNQRIQYPDRLFCAKLVDTLYAEYSELCFANPLLRAWLTRKAKSSAGHQRISMEAVTDAPIPLPPFAEQQEIVRRVQSFFRTADTIEQQYKEAQAYLDQLNQSILAKGFRGELVSQDPNDEPASVLLERIRAEREKLDTKKKAKGKTEKKSRKAKPEAAEPKQLSLPGFE